MSPSAPPGNAPALPADLLGGLIGAESKAEFEFTAQILEALGKISPDLVPRIDGHPLADAIRRGVSAYSDLLTDYRNIKDEYARGAVLDAIATIADREYATMEVVVALQKIMASTKSPALMSLAAKALATAKEEGFLKQQIGFLASDNLNDVRISARLLGHGRYEPAVDVLVMVVRPDNMAVADVAIWALGEIGSSRALEKLHGMLSDLVYVEPTIEAVGKIGDRTSVIRLLPLLIEGSTGQREKSAQAVLRIARANGGDLQDVALTRGTMTALERCIDKDASYLARFYALVAYSVLGGHLEPARIKQALGAQLSDKDMGALSVFVGKGRDR